MRHNPVSTRIWYQSCCLIPMSSPRAEPGNAQTEGVDVFLLGSP